MYMEKIVEHVERLLLWHDCVIIPDFGGFVLQSVPAVYTGDEHLFIPSRKEIVFNPTLTHNDGLLTESYMQEYAVDFNEARMYVGADVLGLKENLDDGSHIQFGRIGMFVKEDDRIIFIPAKNSNELFCTSSYGLPVFHYLSLAARRPAVNAVVPAAAAPGEGPAETNDRENKVQSGNILYTIPVTRTFMRVFVAAVATVVIFFLISTPVTDVNSASYSAGFVPREIMPVKSADESVSNAFAASGTMTFRPVDKPATNKETSETKPETSEIKPEVKPETTAPMTKSPATSSPAEKSSMTKSPAASSSAAKSSSASSSVAKSSATKSPATQPSSSVGTSSKAVPGKYYVIIGSFDTGRRAQTYIRGLKGDVAANAGIIESDGKIRVYAQQFSSEKTAQSYLSKIRQNSNHQQAWLYKGR
jgi:hypothetical protein